MIAKKTIKQIGKECSSIAPCNCTKVNSCPGPNRLLGEDVVYEFFIKTKPKTITISTGESFSEGGKYILLNCPNKEKQL